MCRYALEQEAQGELSDEEMDEGDDDDEEDAYGSGGDDEGDYSENEDEEGDRRAPQTAVKAKKQYTDEGKVVSNLYGQDTPSTAMPVRARSCVYVAAAPARRWFSFILGFARCRRTSVESLSGRWRSKLKQRPRLT